MATTATKVAFFNSMGFLTIFIALQRINYVILG
jgi:hypothetical protein